MVYILAIKQGLLNYLSSFTNIHLNFSKITLNKIIEITMTEISTISYYNTLNKIIEIAITEISTQEGTTRVLQIKTYLFTKYLCI